MNPSDEYGNEDEFYKVENGKLNDQIDSLKKDIELLKEFSNRIRHKINSLSSTQNYESEGESIKEFNDLLAFVNGDIVELLESEGEL